MNIIAIGSAIGQSRAYRGMSMRALATKSGLSIASISKIERGAAKSVRPASAQKICAALGKEFDDLFTIETADRTTA